MPAVTMSKAQPTVFVAMSGGVDSSVAAALLKQEGFEVVGVFMKNWSEDTEGTGFCSAEADFADVRAVCQHLDIPYYSFNFEEEYKKRVLEYFFAEYKAGRTPNPDVACNKEIKFDLFLQKAISLGADMIATGHHIRRGTQGGFGLLKGKDPLKDQSYFVYNLTQDQLSRCLFPVGEYTKPQIRQLARRWKLPTATKKDSQGICFIGPVDIKDFLQTVIKPKKGKIVNKEGKALGEHEGAWFYTIGQRRVSGLSGLAKPQYVVATDIKKNTVTVGDDADTYHGSVLLESLHLIDPGRPLPDELAAKPRYGAPDAKGVLTQARGRWQFTFAQPQRALTPGQSLVLYDKEVCLGGGVIARVSD